MLEAWFEALFKYRPDVLRAGEWTLASGAPPWSPGLVAVAAAFVAFWTYGREKRLRPADRAILGVARASALTLAGVALLQPALRVKTVAAQETFVGVIVDDSASFSIRDAAGSEGVSRGEEARRLFVDPASRLRRALDARFKTRLFRFSSQTERLADPKDLAFGGRATDLAQALRHAQQELQATPLSGLVLVTDGADNVTGPLSETLLALRAQGIPVFTVGLGRERFDRDLEITRVEAPTSVLQGSTVVASVTYRARGQGRAPLVLRVEDDGRILSSTEVTPHSPESSTARIAVRVDEPGPRLLRFALAELDGEQVRENNRFDVALDVLGRREKILYFEGSARYEAKFLRRAVRDDRNLQVVTLLRTADEKYLRLDVDDGDELATGFPKSRAELFAYRGVVLGGVEASFFTVDQLRMLSDFVGQRGGGLLMVGSDKTFAEGGYAGTAVAEALPVVLDGDRGATAPREERFTLLKVGVTPLGAAQPMTQLGANENESAKRFAALPALSAVNALERVKPGAAALLVGTPERGLSERIVLASQRFGRGRALALGVQDSWRWQMHADVAADDLAHETLWRQLLRALVSGAGGPVAASVASNVVSPGSSVAVRADVSDEAFLRVNDARVVAVVAGPDGETFETPLQWTIDKDGEYLGSFATRGRGVYRVRIMARRGDAALGEDTVHVRAEDSPVEFQNAEMKPETLRRIASETGGRFYDASGVAALPEDLSYSPKTATVVDEKDLWDMPAVFLGIVTALAVEWGLRRARGLA